MSAQNTFDHHDHSGCTRSALAHADALVRERGLRLTPVRRRTLEILLEEHRALGAYDVLERLKADGFGAQPPVAYRALDFLVEHGLVHRVRRLNAFAACTRPGGAHTPVFFICEGCDTVAEAQAADVRHALVDAAAELAFEVDRASLEASGLCAACRSAS